jgi:hypothetical protein
MLTGSFPAVISKLCEQFCAVQCAEENVLLTFKHPDDEDDDEETWEDLLEDEGIAWDPQATAGDSHCTPYALSRRLLHTLANFTFMTYMVCSWNGGRKASTAARFFTPPTTQGA